MSSPLDVYHHGGFTGACGGPTPGDMVEFYFFWINSLFEGGVDVPGGLVQTSCWGMR